MASSPAGSRSDAIEESKLPVVGSIENTRTVIKQLGAEDVIVAITSVSREELLLLCEEVNPCGDTNLRVSSGLYELLTTRVSVSTHGPVPLVGINKLRLEPNQILVKTVFEYTLALLCDRARRCDVFLATAVCLTSPGPVIHRQQGAWRLRTRVFSVQVPLDVHQWRRDPRHPT